MGHMGGFWMARADNSDRFLLRRGGRFYYRRRVPEAAAEFDERGPHIRLSLKTNDLAVARLKRDAFEAADDQLWAGLLSGDASEVALKRYQGAVRRAEAMGFAYRTASDIAAVEAPDQLVARVAAIGGPRALATAVDAVLGGLERPPVPISAALAIYFREIAAPELTAKSTQQRRKWRNIRQRAVDAFVAVAGDLDMATIHRDHALKFYNHWLPRVAPAAGRPSHTASSANRELSSLRTLYGAWFAHFGDRDRPNPFAGLSFAERGKRTRPPLPVSVIRDGMLRPGALAALNAEARGILLALVETGARPSEICNLEADCIRLDAEVPHIRIQPRTDPDNPREIKTQSSVRDIPLVGVALTVFERHRDGFPRYRDREETASATLNKFLRANDLVPPGRFTIYSLRHAFEDRMKEAGLSDELRRILMGHSLDRERYGAGGALAWRRDELAKIVLPFELSIVGRRGVG
jgi:integrase